MQLPFNETTRSSYIMPANADKSMSIDEWLKAEGRDDLNKFLDENYRFTVEKITVDEENNQNVTTVEDSLVSGTCFFTPDGKKMVSFMYDSFSDLNNYRSYTLDLTSKPSGIEDALRQHRNRRRSDCSRILQPAGSAHRCSRQRSVPRKGYYHEGRIHVQTLEVNA